MILTRKITNQMELVIYNLGSIVNLVKALYYSKKFILC
ncbi:MAG: hypothetical protein ACI81T_001731, partial [Bacteroidia bacterium]